MRLGLSSYTYGWAVGVRGHEPAQPLDEQGLLDRCRERGIKLLQIGDNLPLHAMDENRLDRLAERASIEGVQLEVGARGLTLEHVTRYAAIARRLGATLIRFVIDDADYHPAVSEIIQVLQKSIPLLDGLTIGLENHDRFLAIDFRTMVLGAASERIGICLDTANSLGAGEGIEAVAAVLAPFTVNLHIKDFMVRRLPHMMGFTVEGRPAGDGALNIPSLLGKLQPLNRCHTVILEQWTPPETDLELTIAREAAWAVQSLNYLKPFFGPTPV
jgi:sugar phosphate isomerase/epimerase